MSKEGKMAIPCRRLEHDLLLCVGCRSHPAMSGNMLCFPRQEYHAVSEVDERSFFPGPGVGGSLPVPGSTPPSMTKCRVENPVGRSTPSQCATPLRPVQNERWDVSCCGACLSSFAIGLGLPCQQDWLTTSRC